MRDGASTDRTGEWVTLVDEIGLGGQGPTSTTNRRLGGALALAVLVLVTALIAAGAWDLMSDGSSAPAPASAPALASPATSMRQPSTRPDFTFASAGLSLVNVRTGERKQFPPSIRRLAPTHLQVSPVGSRLAFSGRGTVYVANLDGTNIRALTETGVDSAPSWSPDGKRLVYSIEGMIRVIDVRSRQSTRVQTGRHEVYHPNFSGDGQQILFTRLRGHNLALWTTPVMGGHAHPMTNLPKLAAFGSFSPDGSQVAFRRTGFDGSPITEMTAGTLYVADSDGSNFDRVGPTASSRSQVDGGALWPMWSPDGIRIAYERLYGNGVFICDVRTGETSHITTDGTRPTWLDNNTLIVEAM